MKSKVSIIIAAYNIQDYIMRCMKSVINQTFENIEIIVVNDGSSDSTLEILEKLEVQDDRIKIITKKNKGLIEARKTGLHHATGEYILFIDGDDWLELECIEKLYNSAINQNTDILIYNFFWSYDNSKKLGLGFNSKDDDITLNPLKSLFIGNISPCIWTKFIRRQFIEDSNVQFPSNISFAEDLATVASLFIFKPKIGILNENLYNYYQRDNSITKEVGPKILEVNKAILFIKEQMIKNKIYDEYKSEFEGMIYSHLFLQRFLTATKIQDIHKEVYNQYKKHKIVIKNNKYINKLVDGQPISLKIRMKSYNTSYYLGYCYDLLRKFFI